MRILHQIVNTALLLLTVIYMQAQNMLDLHAQIDKEAAAMNEQVIQWRHHFHQYPELSNREFKTADAIAEYLTNMGYQVDRSFAKTGVVAVLDSGKPGPTVGLRADIDALPVTERTPIPFASKETSTYLGQEVGVMHACGHDTHISMLLGTAAILKDMKDQLRGKVVFVFQPAEEGAPPGEEGGAGLMVKEGLLEKYGIQVMFGQHIGSGLDVGKLVYKSGGMLAAADVFNIKVTGKQTHGSQPWSGIDPITVSAQIIMGLQTIISRQTELTKEAAVITVGKITGGVRNNIIPETCEMTGTIRTLDTTMQRIIHEKIRLTATKIAESAGAKADVEITIGVPVTYNDPNLTQMMVPSLQAAAGGADNVLVTQARTGAEDFSFFAEKVPSLFWSTGGKPLGTPPGYAAPHHTPDFFIDESGMQTGVKAMCYVTVDYLLHQGVVKP